MTYVIGQDWSQNKGNAKHKQSSNARLSMPCGLFVCQDTEKDIAVYGVSFPLYFVCVLTQKDQDRNITFLQSLELVLLMMNGNLVRQPYYQ